MLFAVLGRCFAESHAWRWNGSARHFLNMSFRHRNVSWQNNQNKAYYWKTCRLPSLKRRFVGLNGALRQIAVYYHPMPQSFTDSLARLISWNGVDVIWLDVDGLHKRFINSASLRQEVLSGLKHCGILAICCTCLSCVTCRFSQPSGTEPRM